MHNLKPSDKIKVVSAHVAHTLDLFPSYIGLIFDACFFCLHPSSPDFWWLLPMVYSSSDGL